MHIKPQLHSGSSIKSHCEQVLSMLNYRRRPLLRLWRGLNEGIIYRNGMGVRDPIKDIEGPRDLQQWGAITTSRLEGTWRSPVRDESVGADWQIQAQKWEGAGGKYPNISSYPPVLCWCLSLAKPSCKTGAREPPHASIGVTLLGHRQENKSW